MNHCIFCDIDNNKVENTIIDETNKFYILPSIGALVDGYVLVVSKRHLNSMSELTKSEMNEYKFIIEKYRNLFKNIYGKFPIVFEHGSPLLDSDMKANSVVHAHTHIVNHQYIDENAIIKKLNLATIDKINNISNNKNYIMYMNSNGSCYVTYNFEPISQMMRKLIAKDLGFENKFDWKKEMFLNNINSTIEKLKYVDKGSD